MLGMSDGATDDPTGLSWSMGVAVQNMLSYYIWLPYYMAAVLLLMAAMLWQLYYYTLYMVFRSPVGFCGWSVAI